MVKRGFHGGSLWGTTIAGWWFDRHFFCPVTLGWLIDKLWDAETDLQPVGYGMASNGLCGEFS